MRCVVLSQHELSPGVAMGVSQCDVLGACGDNPERTNGERAVDAEVFRVGGAIHSPDGDPLVVGLHRILLAPGKVDLCTMDLCEPWLAHQAFDSCSNPLYCGVDRLARMQGRQSC